MSRVWRVIYVFSHRIKNCASHPPQAASLIQMISDIFPFCHPCVKQTGDCHDSFGKIHQLILCKCHELMPFSVTWHFGRTVNISQSPTFPGTLWWHSEIVVTDTGSLLASPISFKNTQCFLKLSSTMFQRVDYYILSLDN